MNFLKNQALKQKSQQQFLSIKDIKPNSKLNYVNNYIINQCQFFHNNFYESEATIARKMGCNESTVKRSVRLMRSLGIIKRRRRFDGIRTYSNVYSLNPAIRTPYWVDQLASHLPALRNLLCLSFLLPTMVWCQKASDHCIQRNDRLYSITKLLNRTELILSTTAKQYAPARERTVQSVFAQQIIKEPEKNLKREVCSTLNNERELYMQYDFLKPKAHRSADMLGLTIAGAIRIAKYSEEAHEFAFSQYSKAAKVRRGEVTDTLRYYISICNVYCREHAVSVDHGIDNRLQMQYGISDSTELYLPADQRVKVEMSTTKSKTKLTEGNVYRETTNSWKESKDAYPFKHGELDDIAEAIKMVAFLTAGIHGDLLAYLPPAESFIEKAKNKILAMLAKCETYNLQLEVLILQIDEKIEYTIEKHANDPHIQMISSVEDAKMKAHQAIAEFIPKLLAPFSKRDRKND